LAHKCGFRSVPRGGTSTYRPLCVFLYSYSFISTYTFSLTIKIVIKLFQSHWPLEPHGSRGIWLRGRGLNLNGVCIGGKTGFCQISKFFSYSCRLSRYYNKNCAPPRGKNHLQSDWPKRQYMYLTLLYRDISDAFLALALYNNLKDANLKLLQNLAINNIFCFSSWGQNI